MAKGTDCIQNDVIGLVLREICISEQMTDFIAWPSRCHDTICIMPICLCAFLSKRQICTIEVDPPLGGTDGGHKREISEILSTRLGESWTHLFSWDHSF